MHTRFSRRLSRYAMLCLLLPLLSCGSEFDTCHACPQLDFSGSWTGSLQVPSMASGGRIDMAIVENLNEVHSTRVQILSAIGPPDCGTTGTVTGTINATKLNLTLSEDSGDVLTLIGTVGAGTMSGTYTSTGTCTNGMSGSFTFAQVPPIASTQWSGSISSASSMNTFTANLTEDANANLTGTVQLSGTACMSPISVTGNLTGIQFFFQDTSGGSMISASGSLSGTDAKTASGFASGSCLGSGGNLSMSRP
jgi:hypothetical protein